MVKLRAEISKLPQKPTVKQQLKIASMHAHLGRQVKDFIQVATVFLPALEEVDLLSFKEDKIIETPAEEAVEAEDIDLDDTVDYDDKFESQDETEIPLVHPEEVVLPLLSNIISVQLRVSHESLMVVEKELQNSQANDALEGLCVGLANKSLLLLTDVNQSTTTKQST